MKKRPINWPIIIGNPPIWSVTKIFKFRAISRNFWHIFPQFWFKMEKFIVSYYYFHFWFSKMNALKPTRGLLWSYPKISNKVNLKSWVSKLIFGRFIGRLIGQSWSIIGIGRFWFFRDRSLTTYFCTGPYNK